MSNALDDPRDSLTPGRGGALSPVRTDIPARLDRLPWCRFHVLLVAALGITWILDGLEVTIVGSIGPILQDPRTLRLSTEQIGGAASVYVVGAVIGALLFGWLTDRYGRKSIFNITLGIYIVGVLLSAFSWDVRSFMLFRFVTGIGIGGEYSAINSAIDELIPARLRGRVDLIVNGSFWVGAGAGAGASRGRARPAHPAAAPLGAGKRALAGDARAAGRGHRRHGRDRAPGGAVHRPSAARR